MHGIIFDTPAAQYQFMRSLSAERKDNTIIFTVWAPEKEKMILHLVHPKDEQIEMKKNEEGYWQVSVNDLPANTRYFFQPNGERDYPDPASRYQPEGVHGPSQLVDHSYKWSDENWKGLPREKLIIYELHVGTFTQEGTFEAIIPRLEELKETGINAIEIMPIAQFSGNRNWGYDGVFPFAVQNSYGGPDGLKKLVDACHQKGIAVILDVVYNHQGPEGNYLNAFAPYFSSRYHTLWGDAINFDWEWSDGVREFYSQNALYWFDKFHIDGLRFDAIHAIFDYGPVHFWEYLHKQVKELEQELQRPLHLIAESDLNDPRVVDSPEKRGFGFDAQWLDDFHHALYKVLYKQDKDRYNDFGSMKQLAKAYTDGFVHSGDEWVKFRKRKYGASSVGTPGDKFIVFNLNHDQIGNRPDGARLSMLVNFEKIKVAAAALFLSPYIPMLFMGEEYADDTPFYYFVSHSDPDLVEAVRKGRKEEFKDSGFNTEPPDAQDEKTFQDSVIQWEKRNQGKYRIMLEWHKELIRMRQTLPALKNFEKKNISAEPLNEDGLMLIRRSGSEQLIAFFNFSENELSYTIPASTANAKKILDSKEKKWIENETEEIISPEEIKPNQTFSLQPLSVAVYYSS